jgi:DNA-binding SARP family transcriptional activator
MPLRDPQGRPLLRVQTLGTATMHCGDVRIGPSAGILFALILRLTHAPGMQLGRETLLDTLWPGQPESRRRANLRQALYKLRSHGLRVRVKGDSASIDATQVVRTFAVERTVARFERDVVAGQEPFGAFLPGFVSPCDAFAEWVQEEREAVHAEVRRVLVTQLRGRRERADWSGAEVLARWLLQFDPLNEDATLTLADCTMLSGSKAEAVAILDRYLEELGPGAGDIRLPAIQLRRRFSEPPHRRSLSFVVTERHFVGRESVIAELTLAMRRARWRDGNALLLHAASGMGKTRVTVELGKVAIVEGFREIRCVCCESDVARSLSIFIDLLPDLLMLPGALGCSPESLATLRRLVPEAPVAVAASARVTSASAEEESLSTAGSTVGLSPHSTTFGGADVGGAHADGVSHRADVVPSHVVREPLPMLASIRRALVDLLAAVADDKPLVLVVDDAHWMDAGSWDVMSDLIERMNGMRVFVLMMSRSPHGRPTRPERIPLTLDVRPLLPLSVEASARLAALIASDMSAMLTEALTAWFVTTSEGSPLFLRALVNHWIETGDAGGIPPTLTQAIEQRLVKLSPDAMRTLQAMALLGVFATAERLQRILELPTHLLLTAIEELELSGSMARSTTLQVQCHELVGRGSVNRLSMLMAGAIHERIAHDLTTDTSVPRSPSLLARIAWHLRSSGNTEALQKFVTSHLDALIRCGSPAMSIALVEEVVLNTPALATELSYIRAKTRLRLEAGEYAGALRESAGALDVPVDTSNLTDASAEELLSILDSSYRADTMARRDQIMDCAISVASRAQLSPQTRLRGAEIALVIASNEGDNTRALRAFECCGIEPQFAESDEDAARVSLIYHTIFGDREISNRIAKRLIKRARTNSASTQRYHDLCRAGYALRFSGTMAEVADAFRAGFDTASDLKLPRLAQYAAWQLATVYLDAGMRIDSAKWDGALLSLFATEDDRVSSNFVLGHLCKRSILDASADSARSLLTEFEHCLPESPTAVAVGFCTALQLGVSLLDPSWAPALNQLATASERHSRIACVAPNDFFTAVLARSYARAGRGSAAIKLVDTYLRSQRRESLPPSLALTSAQGEVVKSRHSRKIRP